MVLARLIQRRSSLEINGYGFPKPVRWFSSHSFDAENEKPSRSEKLGVGRDQGAEAAESHARQRYMESNPGIFHKVGGSWFTVKESLNNLNEMTLESAKPENHHKIDPSIPVSDTAAYTVTTAQYRSDNEIDLHGHHNSTLKADQAQQGEDKEEDSGHSTGMAEAECSCLTEPTSSDVVHMHHSSSLSERNKLNSTQCLDQQKNITSCSLSPNASVEMNTMSAIPGAHQEVNRSSNLFEFGDDEALSDAENSKVELEKVLSDMLIGLRKDKTLFSLGFSQRSNSFSKRPDFHTNMPLSGSYENQPGKEMVASSQAHNTISNMPESFTGSKELVGLEDMKGLNTQVSEFTTNKNGYDSVQGFFQYSEEPKQKDEKYRHEIKGFMDYIKGLAGGSSIATPEQKTYSQKTDESSEKRQPRIQSIATLQSFDNNEGNVYEECHAEHCIRNHDGSSEVLPASLRAPTDKISRLDFTKPAKHLQLSVLNDKEESHKKVDEISSEVLPASLGTPVDKMRLDFTKPAEHLQLPVLNDKEESHEKVDKFSAMEGAGEYKAVVMFLSKTTNKSDIVENLEKCGEILKVVISPYEGAFYRTADVHFKTREGLLNALVKTDIVVKGSNVTVEAAGEAISKTITIPSLIGDPNVPTAVVKNPTRTVKISQLTREISSHDVVKALGPWGGNVTGFFYGTLDSDAYVEFDDVDDKEAILTKHSIDVLGKKLLISRIDIPRTTVVRIPFRHPVLEMQVAEVCNSLGETMICRTRHSNIVDIHFKIAEWPNMLKILNRLNGTRVNGHKLRAKPACIFPAQILQVLWRHPEERIHVRNCVRRLLQKLGERDSTAGLADLPNFY